MDINDPEYIRTCCSRCKFKMYSLLDSSGGVMCRFFFKEEECEYRKLGQEMLRPLKEAIEMVERVERTRKDLGNVGPIQV